MFSIYATFGAMSLVAVPQIKSYHTDLVHDFNIMKYMANGDEAVWYVRESGTYFVRITELGRSLDRRGTFPAINDTFKDGTWYHIKIGSTDIRKLTLDEACEIVAKHAAVEGAQVRTGY